MTGTGGGRAGTRKNRPGWAPGRPWVAACAGAVCLASGGVAAAQPAAPSAPELARMLDGLAHRGSGGTGPPARLTNVDCVRAAGDHYMCSYALLRPRAHRECRLMQGRWTPEGPSTLTITLVGRTARCATLRDALDSLL